MLWKSVGVTAALGGISGGVLGAWVVWQHDALLGFSAGPPWSVLSDGLLFSSCLGTAFGWAAAWCAEKVTGLAGACLWIPVSAGVLSAVVVCLIWAYAALAAPSPPVLAMVAGAFALPATGAAALRMLISS